MNLKDYKYSPYCNSKSYVIKDLCLKNEIIVDFCEIIY